MMPTRPVLFALSCLVLAASGRPLSQEAPPYQRPLDPAGEVVRDVSGRLAGGALPVGMLRSPDTSGPDGRGRYLVVVNSGYGIQVSHALSKAQQSLQVIDLLHAPDPVVVQEVFFPSPESANVGAAFGRIADADGRWPLLVSGGVENRVWRFTFTPGQASPVSPGSDGPMTSVTAPFIDISSAAPAPAARYYNDGYAPVYPTGLAVGARGDLYVAANLGDALVVVNHPDGKPRVRRVDLHRKGHSSWFVYPYDVRVVQVARDRDKAYVSCWNDASIAVVDGRRARLVRRIEVGSHPGALALNDRGTRLAVASANSDTVSLIDTGTDREIERIPVGLGDHQRTGDSPQAVAFAPSGRTLFVANAQSQSVAVVRLSAAAAGLDGAGAGTNDDREDRQEGDRSRVAGYIPTARYPTALAVVGSTLFVGNGKGEPPARANQPNESFPPTHVLRGQYDVSLIDGSLRRVPVPDGPGLAAMTTRVLAANGLVGPRPTSLFSGPSPIHHVIYVIKENRTYDQVLGDLAASGDGTPADGDPRLAIFGAGSAARLQGGPPQDISPNHHNLALRFGLFDRFFVNSEASPDGHAWATSAFSTDYVDKTFRWNYSGRGRTYDYEGFNRLPSYEAAGPLPPHFSLPATAHDVETFMKRYVPYLNGSRDAAEPDSLYLWDAASRAGLSYRNYGEFVGTVSAGDIAAINARRSKRYPDTSAPVVAFATKRALEDHFNATFPNFDLAAPDAFTTESYTTARTDARVDPAVRPDHSDPRFRGTSRLGAWLEEFEQHVADLGAGRGDSLPALSIVRLSSDHTAGMSKGHPTPQFYMADNDYAVGRLVQAVSHSPYWRDTAILVLEDDAQDGADHVDAHRSPVLVVSAYNRRGALIHQMHNTVSLIRTLELLLGLAPMNELDAAAIPMNVFTDTADLTPFDAVLPEVAEDNLMVPRPASASARHWTTESARQDLQNPDMADPAVLNQAIWFSVRGDEPMPGPARMAAVDAMQTGIDEEGEDAAREPLVLARLALWRQLGAR
jgi:YVTN family beta-propeller protein